MKQLVWGILLLCIVAAKASEVLGNHEDLMPGEVSSFVKHVRQARILTFSKEKKPKTTLHDVFKALIFYTFPSVRARYLPAEPSTTCATTTTTTTTTTQAPTSTEPSYMTDNTSLFNDVIIPIIDDIVNDEEALENITRLFQMTVETILPLAAEVLRASSNSHIGDEPDFLVENPEIKIRREIVENTLKKLLNESVPLLKQIVRRKIQYVLLLLSYNTRAILKTVYQVKHRNDSRSGEVWDKSWQLFRKYRDIYLNSTDEFIHTYSILQIQFDIESLLEVFSENSRELFRKNMLILQDVTGIDMNTIRGMIRDIPGYEDVIGAIPPQYFIHLLLMFL